MKWAGKARGKSPGSPCKPEQCPVRSGSRVMCVLLRSLRLLYGITLPQTHYINYHLLIVPKLSQQGGGPKTRVLSVLYALLPACLSPVLNKSLPFSGSPCFKRVFDFTPANETAVGEIGSEQSIFVMRSVDGAL